MLNTLCKIWHDVYFGLLNSAQHYVKTPQWLLDEEKRGGGEKEGRLVRERRGGRKEKWRTSSQMRIEMDLGIDES